jgi:hypothetical protein
MLDVVVSEFNRSELTALITAERTQVSFGLGFCNLLELLDRVCHLILGVQCL